MGIQIISTFNPTHKLCAVGDEKHIECMMEGSFTDTFTTLVSLVSRFIETTAEKCAEDVITDDDAESVVEAFEGKNLIKKDIATVVLWKKFQGKVNDELCKLKIKETLDIPDFIKNALPSELIDAIISCAVEDLKKEVDEEDE